MNKNVFFHGEVEIGEGSSIQDNVILGSEEGEGGKVKIDENALIRSGTVIYSGVEIEKWASASHALTEDQAEAVKAFIEKRKPNFPGR